jgi:spore coat polysaccharide biosynthesis predicted glycosyltransferase SpsG
VITVQPTSPFLTSAILNAALNQYIDTGADTLFSVTDNTHLSWKRDRNSLAVTPNFEKRLNRQWMDQVLKETGSIQICDSALLSKGSRIGSRIELFELGEVEGVDIDTPFQWTFCESVVRRQKWVFVIVGDTLTGSGHAYRALTLADWLAGEETEFVCLPGSELASSILQSRNYRVSVLKTGDIASQILDLNPDIVVNDVLDTESQYVEELRRHGALVCNFEDCGPGADKADVVFNALYDHSTEFGSKFHIGEKYFCLRNEFRFAEVSKVREEVSQVLITFGGTDPNNLSARVVRIIAPFCERNNIEINIITGPGYKETKSLDKLISQYKNVRRLHSVRVMSQQMAKADICFTSCGRTIYELASLGVPAVCIAQNDRELLHTFARPANGIEFLGLASQVTDDQILKSVSELSKTYALRMMMSEVTRQHDLTRGCERIIRTIQKYATLKEDKI